VARKQWSELRPGVRRLVVVGAIAEAALKIAALVDLVRRPADQVRGPKPRWAVAIVVINSLGAVPIAYFRYGRRPPPAAGD
jgi:hypothetical protein